MAADAGRHVLIFGIDVQDDAMYRRYREGMTPILHRYGGSFGYDFIVSQVLESETPARINRAFTMRFPDASTAERFFADPAYRAVRAELFESAVASVTKIGAFEDA